LAFKKQNNNYMPLKKEDYLQLFEKTSNITDWLAYYSMIVWEELEVCQTIIGNKADETEFTNRFIREISKLLKKDEIPLPIRLFHSKNEKTNGSDLEIVLQLKKNQNLIFPCQAKKLYVGDVKNNLKAKYKKLNYENNGSQKKKLIKYAEKIGGFPLYLLYNYSEHNFKKDRDYPHKELYGCSLISAHHLSEHPPKAPTVQALHPPAKPLTSIAKLKNTSKLKDFWGESSNSQVETFSDEQIFNNHTDWREIAPPSYPPKRFVSEVGDIKELLMGKNNLSFIDSIFSNILYQK